MDESTTSKSHEALRISDGHPEKVRDRLVAEAPLQIDVNGEPLVTTMRTPDAHDHELARGLLYTEALVRNGGEAWRFEEGRDPESGYVARLKITLPPENVLKPVENRRSQLATAACGVCGTRSIEDVEVFGPAIELADGPHLATRNITDMLDAMAAAQEVFDATGGAHAAAVFDEQGALMVIREDVGRHNAVDKAVGHLLAEDTLGQARVLVVSGRVSYEIAYKAYRAAIPMLVSISAPSTLAVETCDRLGITLAAWCRDDRATVYTHPERIAGVTVG